MQIRVDWFKPSGKWYSGGLVEIGDLRIWDDGFKQAIVDNQNELVDEWTVDNDFTVVCSNTEAQDNDPNFSGFHHILFRLHHFDGMIKSK